MNAANDSGRSSGLERAEGAARPASSWRDLGPRAASAAVLIAIALAALWRGGDLFLAFWIVAAIGVAWEWQNLVASSRVLLRAAVNAVALVAAGRLAADANAEAVLAVLALGAVGVAAAARENRIWSACGVLYSGAAVAPVCILRASVFDGAESVLWLFAIVWSSDIMAYFGGRAFGGPKLWPRISPGKTWSGAISGVVAAPFFGLLVLRLLHLSIGASTALQLGVLLSIASQAGDLFESFLKRRFGAKDSGHLIPGHGGLMDRLDGFIAASAVAAIIGILRYGAASAALGLLQW